MSEETRSGQSERDSEEDITNTKIPEAHQPTTVRRGKEGFTDRESRDAHITHMSEVNKTREEHNGQYGAVVFDELSNPTMEETAFADFTADPATHENQQCDHDAEIC
ncbi:unnamed protein product [Aspergillus oryzae]|nr:unnamed protein product [Aspergillus oryzae]